MRDLSSGQMIYTGANKNGNGEERYKPRNHHSPMSCRPSCTVSPIRPRSMFLSRPKFSIRYSSISWGVSDIRSATRDIWGRISRMGLTGSFHPTTPYARGKHLTVLHQPGSCSSYDQHLVERVSQPGKSANREMRLTGKHVHALVPSVSPQDTRVSLAVVQRDVGLRLVPCIPFVSHK